MRHLHLLITTPMDVLVNEPAVMSIRAEDESGGFGILPGHCDFLTALPASVVRWKGEQGKVRFCALRAGVMTVEGGRDVAIACREGLVGDDLALLEAEVAKLRRGEEDKGRRARVEQMKLHAGAVRQLVHLLRPDGSGSPAFQSGSRSVSTGDVP